MDGNTPQVESVPGKNRRWNIALATILVVAIIVTVAGILVLVTQTDTVADKTDKASGNIRWNILSQKHSLEVVLYIQPVLYLRLY